MTTDNWTIALACLLPFPYFVVNASMVCLVPFLVQPTFTVQPTNVDKFPQDTAIFACNASGIPQPKITWLHNGANISPSPTGRIQINGKKELKFTSLQSGDTGTVQCVATNDAGEAITTAVLNVKCKWYYRLSLAFFASPFLSHCSHICIAAILAITELDKTLFFRVIAVS